MKLYNRKVKLIVYAGNTARTIEDLWIDFEVKASKSKQPNTAKITVWNLSDKTKGILADSHQAVEFYAGYGDTTTLIFSGETTNVVNTEQGVDVQTTIYAGEGVKNFETKIFKKSYEAGTPVKTVFKDMATEYGLPYTIDDALFEDKLLKGVSYTGRVKDVLEKATKDYGFEWSVQRGVLEILVEGNSIATEPTAVVLRADTGLIGSPAVITRSAKGGKNVQGVRIVSLLNPSIVPGRLIKLEAVRTTQDETDLFKKKANNLDASGVYIAQRLRYYGNNHGGEFNVEIEADIT